MTHSGWLLNEKQLMQLIQPAAAFGIAAFVLLVVRYIVLHSLRRRAANPKSTAAVVLDTIGFPSFLWVVAAALEIALMSADLTASQAARADKWIGAFVIASLTLVAMSAAVRMMTAYGERQAMPFAVAGLTRTLIRITILALGLVSLLANFELTKQITPVLGFLGVGGLAVALALQDTLANFFAGIHILVERPIFVGDYIRLENGQDGIVTDIGWRTTRVRTGGNDMVVIPNSKITAGTLVNYSLPDRRAVVEIAILVAHHADPEQVCRIAVNEALQTSGVLEKPEPLCLCDPGVLPTHVQFKLLVNVASRLEQGDVASEIRMRLLSRFRLEGIPLPEVEIVHAHRR